MLRKLEELTFYIFLKLALMVFFTDSYSTLAAREGLRLAVEKGLQNLLLEGDSLQISSALLESSTNMSTIRPILQDAKYFLKMIAGAIASHVICQANSVGHRLARFGLHCRVDCTWLDETPSLICDLIEEDISIPCTE